MKNGGLNIDCMHTYRLVRAESAKERKRYFAFRRSLYRGDPNDVCTAEFILRSFLNAETRFVRECEVTPVLAEDTDGNVAAECLWVSHPALPMLQLSFFEARPDCEGAVICLLEGAKAEAMRRGLSRVVVGLNGHISYGVGILSSGFESKNTFDSIYNKPYYCDYFRALGLEIQTLSTYRGRDGSIRPLIPSVRPKFLVRCADMDRFEEETEVMRRLCEETIAKTFLYFPTKCGHFFELISDLKPFLKGENLLFVEAEGRPVGFLFWHPDFNQMISGGRPHSLLSIGSSWVFQKKRIDTLKLNAIGVLDGFGGRATQALLYRLKELTEGRFENIETNFVWDNNVRSTALNRRLFGERHRSYEVYFADV